MHQVSDLTLTCDCTLPEVIVLPDLVIGYQLIEEPLLIVTTYSRWVVVER